MRTYCLISAMFGLLLAGGAHAQQNYPTKPIRLIVPYAAGGGGDIVARMLAPKLIETFKQAVVVDNRPGAGSTIGTETAVRSNPDGYTLFLATATYAANAALYKLPFDPLDDVAPIVMIGEVGFVMSLHPSVSVTSIKELIAYDKANPGKLNYGSAGPGSTPHLASELFNQTTGTELTHVPYKGVSAALTDLIGGHIQLFFGSMLQMTPHFKSNRVRGIAVTSSKRSSLMPHIPTVAETVPGYEAGTWFSVLGPKGLPKDIIARWNGEINRILQLPDVKARMSADGMEPVGGSSERFREVLKRDVSKWQKVVKTANIKPEN